MSAKAILLSACVALAITSTTVPVSASDIDSCKQIDQASFTNLIEAPGFPAKEIATGYVLPGGLLLELSRVKEFCRHPRSAVGEFGREHLQVTMDDASFILIYIAQYPSPERAAAAISFWRRHDPFIPGIKSYILTSNDNLIYRIVYVAPSR